MLQPKAKKEIEVRLGYSPERAGAIPASVLVSLVQAMRGWVRGRSDIFPGVITDNRGFEKLEELAEELHGGQGNRENLAKALHEILAAYAQGFGEDETEKSRLITEVIAEF